jgi:RNA polymerase sigma factor for flagellar operon FliA
MSVVNACLPSRREDLILSHLPQVRFLALKAFRRCPPAVGLDDLISAGTVGLISSRRSL